MSNNPKDFVCDFEIGTLGFIWNLVLGVWCFSFRVIPSKEIPGYFTATNTHLRMYKVRIDLWTVFQKVIYSNSHILG